MAQVEQAIHNGTPAPTVQNVFVLFVPNTDGKANRCTATLITPAHALTSAHCFNGAIGALGLGFMHPAMPGATVTLSNDPLGGVAQPLATAPAGGAFSVTHTPGARGPNHQVRTLAQGQIQGDDAGGINGDLAIVPLDQRVPLSRLLPAALPYHPDGTDAGGCPSSFDGDYFGYSQQTGGVTPFLAWNNLPEGDAGTRKRGFHPVDRVAAGGYYKGEFALSAEFWEFIPVLGDLYAAVTGSGEMQMLQPGDSGGPLFNVNTVCGVNARVWPHFSILTSFWSCEPIICDPVTGTCLPLPVHCDVILDNHHTTITLPHQRDFILGEIVDSTGARFKGICDQGPVGLRDIDTDGDLIPDACDPCPFSADADYDLSKAPDPDQDDVPERCDNCPNVFNPIKQADIPGGGTFNIPQPDQDGDGRGDACDWDPYTQGINDPDTNRNFEAEIVAYYPDLDDEPELAPSQAEADTYAQAFRDGRNESVPAPRFTVGYGWLPEPLANIHSPNPPPLTGPGSCAAEAGVSTPIVSCTVELLNRIDHLPAVPALPPNAPPPTFSHPATGLNGSVGTFWCPCGGLGLGNSRTDRLKCRQSLSAQCIPTQTNLNSSNTRWVCAHLVPTPPVPYEGQIFPPSDWLVPPSTADLTYPFVNETSTRVYWDFTRLDPGCADPANPGDLQCINEYSRAIGVLWTNLRDLPGLTHSQFTGTAGSAVDQETVRERGGFFWSGIAGYRVTAGDSFVAQWGQGLPDALTWPCWLDGCPPKVFDPLTVMIINPTTVFTSSGSPDVHPAQLMSAAIPSANGSISLRSDEAFGTAAAVLHAAWIDPDRLYVAAGEPRARVALDARQRMQLRAIVLRKSTGQPLQMVSQAGTEGEVVGLDLRSPAPEPDLPPEQRPLSVAQFDAKHPKHPWTCKKLRELGPGTDFIRDREGVALSALRNELIAFGGFQGGGPAPSLRVLGLDGAWNERPLEPGARPGNVLAAIYHFADDAYYEVDSAGFSTRLRRLSTQSWSFETLAHVPPLFRLMDRHWLVSGLDGDLFFAGTWRHLSAIARFVVSTDGSLEFGGVKLFPHEILTRPLAGYGNLVVVRAPHPGELKATARGRVRASRARRSTADRCAKRSRSPTSRRL